MKILVCGDLKGYTEKYQSFFNNKNENIFGDLKSYIASSDSSFYNQEFSITDYNKVIFTKLSGGIAKHTPKVVDHIRKAGFRCACFANNHTLDYGIQGVKDTIKFLSEQGISIVGAGETLDEAKKPYFFSKDRIKICVLNYAETQFNIATEKHGGANPLDVINNYNEIRKYRNVVDHVIVIIHGGTDFSPYPSPRMIKQYRFYIDAGASAVVNHHQHVVSGYEIYKGNPIFYGIGSIIPGKIVIPGCLYGIAVDFNIEKESLNWEMIPLKFNEEKMRLEILQGNDRKLFFEEVNSISEIIQNPILLKKKYGDFLNEKWRKTGYNISFSKHSRIPFRIAKKMKLVNFYTKLMGYIKFRNNFTNNTLWNLIRCETHRDVLAHFYEEDIDTYRNE